MTGVLARLLPIVTCAALVIAGVALRDSGAAAPPRAIQETWSRVDRPVAADKVERTWLWGPQESSFQKSEPYAESPGGKRTVVYFDKSRMEITNPGASQSSAWFVANGLLVVELVSGRMQVGDDTFVSRRPADINVAGDLTDAGGPTYATFGALTSVAPVADGATLIQRVARDGSVTDDPALARFSVVAAYRARAPGIDHQIAAPFWDFMRATGVVYQNGAYEQDSLFANPFYATGYPITEAYWATVTVLGTPQDVLVQCFERRCLTYTPSNPPGWQVEAGNVGQHYYTWRYGGNMP